MGSAVSEIMNIGELAEYLRVSRTTLYQLSQKGRIPGTKVGKSWRYHKDAIYEWLKDRDIYSSAPESSEEAEKIRVLIVDDDESVLNVLKGGLEKQEGLFEIYTAKDGFEAGHKVHEFDPQIVILDIFLPGIDGYQVCRMIKEKHEGIRVIAITGQGSEEVKQNILKAGADIYLQKPFAIEDLSVCVMGMLRETVIE